MNFALQDFGRTACDRPHSFQDDRLLSAGDFYNALTFALDSGQQDKAVWVLMASFVFFALRLEGDVPQSGAGLAVRAMDTVSDGKLGGRLSFDGEAAMAFARAFQFSRCFRDEVTLAVQNGVAFTRAHPGVALPKP